MGEVVGFGGFDGSRSLERLGHVELIAKAMAVCFDTETTDLVSNRTVRDEKLPRITQIYACLVDLDSDDPPEKELNLFFNPGCAIPEKIQRITRITTEFLADKPPFFKHAIEIRSFLTQAPMVIAHNASFDCEVVEIELARAGVSIEWPEIVCTVEQTTHFKGRRLSLGDLHELLFSERFVDAHRADVDVAALVRVARELRRRGDL